MTTTGHTGLPLGWPYPPLLAWYWDIAIYGHIGVHIGSYTGTLWICPYIVAIHPYIQGYGHICCI